MTQDEDKTAAELLADWRAAERDTIAAGQGSKVATLALEAAAAAEEAASEVEMAAAAATEAVERARSAAMRARTAAAQAATAAHLALATAEGNQLRANQDLESAQHAESAARDRFHEAQNKI